MVSRKFPPTDITEMFADIRKHGRTIMLPCSMPQKWLFRIARDVILVRRLEAAPKPGHDPADHVAPVVALVVSILTVQQEVEGKSDLGKIAIPETDVRECVHIYSALVLEEVAARATGVTVARYDMSTIFA